MARKSKKPVRKQTHSPTGKVVGQVGQGTALHLAFPAGEPEPGRSPRTQKVAPGQPAPEHRLYFEGGLRAVLSSERTISVTPR